MIGMTSRRLAEALLACASGIRHLEAGTSLLIECGSWLHREDFTSRFITTGTSTSDGATTLADTDWEAAIAALRAGELPAIALPQHQRVWHSGGMGTGYDPTQFVDGVDTGKIRMARRFVGAMRGTRDFDRTLLELAGSLREAGRAEEAVKVLEFLFVRVTHFEAPDEEGRSQLEIEEPDEEARVQVEIEQEARIQREREEPDEEARVLLEFEAVLREAGRAEKADLVMEFADGLIEEAVELLHEDVAYAQESGDLPAQCFAFIALAQKLRYVDRMPQAESAFKSAEEISDRISVIVRQGQYEPAQLDSWIAGLYSLNELYRLLRREGREEAAERLRERCNGYGRNMADAAMEIGFREAAQSQEDQDPRREGKAMAMLARALHEAGREHESAFCAAEARRLGYGYRTYNEISGQYFNWSSTAKPGSTDPAAYGYNNPAAYGHDDDDKPYGPITGPPGPEVIGEVIAGYLAIKAVGPFLQAFATKLGEQLGEATGNAISRLRLRRRPHTRDQIEVEVGTKTIVVLPDPFTDNEREAFIDIDVTDPHIRGKTLHWDGNKGKFLPEEESGSDLEQG